MTLRLFLEATVDTFDAIKTPINTRTTCPNMKEQRRGSYRDCQLSFLITIRDWKMWNIAYAFHITESFQEYIILIVQNG